MEKTIVIFGRSLFINEIKNYIPEIIKKYDTIGINTFYKSYPDIKYVIFKDKTAAPDKLIDNTIITDIKNMSEVIEQKNVELWKVITNREEFATAGANVLNFYYFTSSMAINWAYLKGYKNVILAGVDLMNNRHFDDKNHNPVIDENLYFKTKNYMEKICAKYVNLYQLNPKSDLALPKIKVNEL